MQRIIIVTLYFSRPTENIYNYKISREAMLEKLFETL